MRSARVRNGNCTLQFRLHLFIATREAPVVTSDQMTLEGLLLAFSTLNRLSADLSWRVNDTAHPMHLERCHF